MHERGNAHVSGAASLSARGRQDAVRSMFSTVGVISALCIFHRMYNPDADMVSEIPMPSGKLD